MGNEGSNTQKNNRRRSLPTKSHEEDQPSRSRRNYNTINQSLQLPPPSSHHTATPSRASRASRQYRSIQYEVNEDHKSVKSDRLKGRQSEQQDKALQKLGKRNEDLRRQLKKISEELTEKIKKKRFIPKKKGQGGQDDQQDDKYQANQANAGVRRQLQNGYRQIEMYKRTIEALKGKNEQHQTDLKVKLLQNSIASSDTEINLYIRKIEGMKRMKKDQDKYIEKDINEDLKGGVVSLKKELQTLKKLAKDYTNRERQREVNYKKQQAYLFEVQKKSREVNGQYFPELKKRVQEPMPINSRVTKVKQDAPSKFSVDQYFEVQQILNQLKRRHEQYNKRMDAKVLQKNKLVDEQNNLEQNIRYSDKVIETLRLKLKQVKKIVRPTKKSLFGYDSYTGGELVGQYNGGADEIQKQIQEQNLQDQFDIKHLIANIPRPVRPKVTIQFQDNGKPKNPRERPNGISREQSQNKRGMAISGEKGQPKKWGSSFTREQQKGRGIKKEVTFNDGVNLPADAKPLIIGINVWLNKNSAIIGLQAIYLIKDEIRYGTKTSNSANGFLQRYDLQSPDYLKNVTGTFSQDGFLQFLVLNSKQGKTTTFGHKTDGQQQFNYGISSTQRPFRLFGASFLLDQEPRINRLGLQICQEE